MYTPNLTGEPAPPLPLALGPLGSKLSVLHIAAALQLRPESKLSYFL